MNNSNRAHGAEVTAVGEKKKKRAANQIVWFMFLLTEKEKEELTERGAVERENMIRKTCVFFCQRLEVESLLSLVFCINMTAAQQER